MKCGVLTSLLCFAVVVSVSNAGSLPSAFKKCSKSDPNLDECLRDAIEGALRYITINGLPKVKIPVLDPIVIPEVSLDTQGAIMQAKQVYTNLKFYGYGDNIVVSKAHLDQDTNTLTFTEIIPRIKFTGNYSIEGNILFLPIHGSGQIFVAPVNATTSHTISLKEKTVKGKTYFDVASYKIDWTLGGVTFRFENLFNGDIELSENVLKTMMENWRGLYLDVKSEFEAKNEEVYKTYAQNLFDFVPVDDIFTK